MAAFDDRLGLLRDVLIAMRDKGPRYRNHLGPDFPLDDVLKTCAALEDVCAALESAGEDKRDQLTVLQLHQSRLLSVDLPPRQPYEPLDADEEPQLNAFRNLFGDVITELGRLAETFLNEEREAARPATRVDPVDRAEVSDEADALEDQVAQVKKPVEELHAKVASDIKVASNNTVRAALGNIENLTINININLDAFAKLLRDGLIKVDWGGVLHRNLGRLGRVVIDSIDATDAVRSTLSEIAATVHRELKKLLSQSCDFLSLYVEIEEDGESLEEEGVDTNDETNIRPTHQLCGYRTNLAGHVGVTT